MSAVWDRPAVTIAGEYRRSRWNFTYQVVAGSATVGTSDRIVNRFMGSGANGYCIDEFNSDNFDHAELGSSAAA